MKVEYDSVRDLLYIWFSSPDSKAAHTEIISPGVHADFDRDDQLIGIEVLEASKVLHDKLQVEIALVPTPALAGAA